MRLGGLVDRVSTLSGGGISRLESAIDQSADGACQNCGEGPVNRFCARCGQRQITPHDFTLRGFAHDSFSELTSFDGRLWNTLVTLVAHPGKLARDYFDGRGNRYMKPLSLFVLLNFVFFVVQPHTGLMQFHLDGYLNGGVESGLDAVNAKRIDRALELRAKRARSGLPPLAAVVESPKEFAAHFEDSLQDMKKSMLIVGIPVFALALAIVFLFQRRMAEHLVFSSHFWAFFLLFMTFVTPLFQLFMPVLRALGAPIAFRQFLVQQNGLLLVMFIAFGTYLYFALRRMYGGSAIVSVARAVVLVVALEGFLFGFTKSLFAATLWTL